MKKKRNKPKAPRNLLAISAQFRNSAGAIKEKTKKEKRNIFNEIVEGIEELKRKIELEKK